MLSLIISVILLLLNVLIWLVIINALLSFILPPYHPLRETLDRIVDPLLRPIRQVMPSTGQLDFSPLVLIILIQVVMLVLRSL